MGWLIFLAAVIVVFATASAWIVRISMPKYGYGVTASRWFALFTFFGVIMLIIGPPLLGGEIRGVSDANTMQKHTDKIGTERQSDGH